MIEFVGELEDWATCGNLLILFLFFIMCYASSSTISFFVCCLYTTLILIKLNKIYIDEVWIFQNEIEGNG